MAPESKGGQGFPKSSRILRRTDFLRVQRQGRKLSSRSFLIFVRKNRRGETRLGITVSKRVGNAVRRNRLKRLIREVYRLNRAGFPVGVDVVVVVKKSAEVDRFAEVRAELVGVARKHLR